MKITIYVMVLYASLFAICAQVGINTSNPLGVFHVDGKGDNSSAPTTLQALNDVVITAEGNLGIGTISPTVKLQINTGGTVTTPIPGFRLKDGSESNGRFLVSDKDGIGSWAAAYNTVLVWDANRKFTMPITGLYLITMYLDDNNTTGVFTNIWANPTLSSKAYNRLDLYSETRGEILISNSNTQGNYGVSLSGVVYLTQGEVVTVANLSWSAAGVSILGVEIIPI